MECVICGKEIGPSYKNYHCTQRKIGPLTVSIAEKCIYEEVKPMIKVNRKPVDKDEALKIMLRIMFLNEMSNKAYLSFDEKLDRANGMVDAVIKNIHGIYESEQQGEIESIEVVYPWPLPTMIDSDNKTVTVRLTLEQCKEIAKAIQ